MELQPPNLFIRGASFGGLVTLSDPVTMYKYLTPKFHGRIINDARAALKLPPPVYLTTYRFYTSLEALRSLALPGPAPTYVLELHLAPGVELQGPAFVEALSSSAALLLPGEHRYGNGIELLLLTPLSAPRALTKDPVVRPIGVPAHG